MIESVNSSTKNLDLALKTDIYKNATTASYSHHYTHKKIKTWQDMSQQLKSGI